jgi:hypothetical protein
VDNFLLAYYDIISDGVITSIEANKLRFKGRVLGVTSETAERILNRPI